MRRGHSRKLVDGLERAVARDLSHGRFPVFGGARRDELRVVAISSDGESVTVELKYRSELEAKSSVEWEKSA